MELKPPPTSATPTLLDPLEHPPPLNTKLLIYTITGLIIHGPWRDDGYCAMWMPAPQVGREKRDELVARFKAAGSQFVS